MSAPLADRLRPAELDNMVGQRHLLAPGKVLRRIIESDEIPSMIFWAKPPWPASLPARPSAGCTGSTAPPQA